MAHFYTQLEHALRETDPTRKCEQTLALYQQYQAGSLKIVNDRPALDIQIAGRPARPELVPATAVDKRKTSTAEGYAAMLHAIAHIEFNAINLALDAAYRFRTLPAPFAENWLQVAKEECEHFALMRARLNAHGYDYGDFTAHAHLWDMAYKTAYDPLLRMALVPRVLEARLSEGIRLPGDHYTGGSHRKDEASSSKEIGGVVLRRGRSTARHADRTIRTQAGGTLGGIL